MGELTRLSATAAAKDLTSAIERDGAVIVENLIDAGQAQATLDELRPHIEATPTGPDDFAGHQTTRTGALVARSPACRELILNDSIIETCNEFPAAQLRPLPAPSGPGDPPDARTTETAPAP